MFKTIVQERDLAGVQLQGLKELSRHPLKCSACGEVLLQVLIVKEMEWTAKWRATCPFCPVDARGNPEMSFPITTTGQPIFEVGVNTILVDTDFLDDDEVDLSVVCVMAKGSVAP